MGPEGIKQTIQLGNETITIETGRLAKQADGAAVVTCGKTMLLATVVTAKDAKEDVDFLPLSVDYKEKYAATGKFPGGFFKREGKPSDYEILISRLVDRALRPLFPDDYHAETQVQISLISGEVGVLPDAYAALAASAALAVSDIPFNGPISEVRVAYINGEYVINPREEQLKDADLELMVAASMKDICMVEGESKEVSEEVMLNALKAAHDAIRVHCQAQIELAAKVEKAQTKREYCHETNDETLRADMMEKLYKPCYDFALTGNANKHEREANFGAILDSYLANFSEEELAEKASLAKRYFHDIQRKAVRDAILIERKRLDGRRLDQIRPIWTEVDVLPSTHGSAIFTRGETQALVTVTLGTKLDEQTIDGAVVTGTSNFMLHYNFPSFATGECKPSRGVSRREIGHGNLAERALKSMVPGEDENPYTIRVVSDILESNGSSSMASVCGGTLALLDAGVKMKKPVAGIAMGLITDNETGKYAVLSDILGDEDHLGDMDFKVTGTKDGITACQMDIKVDGLSYEVLAQALAQANAGRMHIMDTVGGGRFMSKTSGGAFGGVVMVSTNEVNDSLFELCSGTITRDADNKGSRRGGLIHVSATASFRMTGGMLLNGSTVNTASPDIKEPGGCVAGAGTLLPVDLAGKVVGRYQNEADIESPMEAEKLLNRYRLDFLETLRPMDSFSEDFVFYYG